jgi:endonuclease III-like uncharacterized protein
MISEVRAAKVQKNARVQRTFNSDIGPVPQKRAVTNRKRLTNSSKSAQPAADRILLFAGISPVAAIPSDQTHVLIRLLHGKEYDTDRNNYRMGQQALAKQLPENFYARRRAYLLIKRHGEKTCKRANPKCLICPVKLSCVFFAETRREELD